MRESAWARRGERARENYHAEKKGLLKQTQSTKWTLTNSLSLSLSLSLTHTHTHTLSVSLSLSLSLSLTHTHTHTHTGRDRATQPWKRWKGGGHNTRFKCGVMKALAVYILALPRAYVAGLFLVSFVRT